jgi:hypothetical protein
VEQPADLTAAAEVLKEFESVWRLDVPGPAPQFDVAAAMWAATMLYRAAQCAVFRDIPEATLRQGLSLKCPATSDEAARHYSVDLSFRFLPDLMTLARRTSPEDPLLQELQSLANQWPLSSVGMKGIEPASVDAIAGHVGLLQLYVDRIVAREDFARLSDQRVRTAARQTAGAYAELSPTLARHLQKHE